MLFLLLALTATSQAQMEKGSWMLDGQAGTYLSKFEENLFSSMGGNQNTSYRNTNFYLQPGVGYFVKENWAVGLSGNFQFVGGKSLYDDGSEAIKGGYRVYGLGLFTRRYIPAGDRISFYGDLRFGGYLGNTGVIDPETSDRTVDGKRRGLEGSANLGIQYLVTDFLGIHLQSSLLQYQFYRLTPVNYEGTSGNSALDIGLFSSFTIGATFFF